LLYNENYDSFLPSGSFLASRRDVEFKTTPSKRGFIPLRGSRRLLLMKAVTRNTLASAAMLSSATSISLITNNADVGHAAVLRLRSNQTHKSEQQHFALNNNLPTPVQQKLKEGIMSISHSISMSIPYLNQCA